MFLPYYKNKFTLIKRRIILNKNDKKFIKFVTENRTKKNNEIVIIEIKKKGFMISLIDNPRLNIAIISLSLSNFFFL